MCKIDKYIHQICITNDHTPSTDHAKKKEKKKHLCKKYIAMFIIHYLHISNEMSKSLHNIRFFLEMNMSLCRWTMSDYYTSPMFLSMSQPWSLSRPGSPDRQTDRCLLLRVEPARRVLCVWGGKPVRVWHNVPESGWKSLFANRVLWIWNMRSGGVLDPERQSDAGRHARSSQTVTHRLWDGSLQSVGITFIRQETGRSLKTWRKAVHELMFLFSLHILCFGLSDRVLQKQNGVFQDLRFL